MIVRPMETYEFDSVITLCEYYRQEAGISDEDYDENSIIEGVRIRNINPHYRWLTAFEGQRPVGFICGFATAAPWNKRILFAQIELIFLINSHRNMENFRQLVSEFESWARGIGATKLITGDIGVNIERSRRIYGYMGFDEGLWMTKEIEQ